MSRRKSPPDVGPKPKCARGHEQARRWKPGQACLSCGLEDARAAAAQRLADAAQREREAARDLFPGSVIPRELAIVETSTGRRSLFRVPVPRKRRR